MEEISRAEAKRNSKTRFYTGVMCKNNHLCERLTNTGVCVECARAMKKRYALKHPEAEKALKARTHQKNKHKYKDRAEKYAKDNKEEIKSYQRKYYLDNKVKILKDAKQRATEKSKEIRIYKKQYSIKNKEKIREYSKQYRKSEIGKLVHHVSTNKRMAQKKTTSDGTVTTSSIKEMMNSQLGKCNYCKKDISDNYHIDHIKPLSKGGTHRIVNIQLLCPFCNISKSDKYEE